MFRLITKTCELFPFFHCRYQRTWILSLVDSRLCWKSRPTPHPECKWNDFAGAPSPSFDFRAIKSQETCEQIVRSRKVQFPSDAAAFCRVICLPNIDWLELCALSPVVAAPSPGNHQFRTLSLNQRLLEAPYLRDLEPFRRKSLSQLNNNSSSIQTSNSNVPAIECGYKPNAPQIQGK